MSEYTPKTGRMTDFAFLRFRNTLLFSPFVSAHGKVLNYASHKKIDVERKPQSMVAERASGSEIEGEEACHRACHGKEHGARMGEPDQKAVADECRVAAQGHGHCPGKIGRGKGQDGRVGRKQPQYLISEDEIQRCASGRGQRRLRPHGRHGPHACRRGPRRHRRNRP